MRLERDTKVYVGSGLFAIAVFVAAVVVLHTQTGVDVRSGTVATLTVGFFLFMGSYFVAMAIYFGIGREDI